MEKIRYTLVGLDCAGCAAKAEAAVNKAPWIEKATVDFMNKRLTVVLSDINPNATEDIQQIVDSVLVGVQVVECTDEPENKAHKHSHKHEHDNEHGHEHGGKASTVMIVTTIIAVIALAAGLGAKAMHYEIVSAVAFAAAILLAGYDVIINGVKSVFRLRLDESALMSIAMVAAAILGEFFEGAMVAILFRIGEWLEDVAVDNSRQSIEKLAEIRPDTANVKRAAGVAVVRAEEVEIGETILIRPHERIPLDCIVIDGNSTVDSSALTGESVPIAAEVGTELLSGMMNGDGSLTAKTTNNYENSAAARIISLVTEASENKGSAEKFVTRFAVIYTPIVVALAVLIAVIPPLLGLGTFRDFVFRSLTFLVASCPCAIVISIPLAFFSTIGGASKFGVLVKGGNFAELLAKARAVAFDKTGTVTTGKPQVNQVLAEDGFTAE
ncbi:MAG: HAD-IC family P-type ATPase, partial [Acutalibacteraceae bacterium]